MSAKQLVRRVLAHTPYEIHRRPPPTGTGFLGWELGDEAREAAERIRASTMLSEEGLAVLYQQITYCQRASIPGAFVECGVWHGGSAGLIAQAALRYGPARELHLFDSFVGIPEPVAEVDGSKAVSQVGGPAHARGRLQVASDYAHRGGPGSPEMVVGLLTRLGYPSGAIHVHQGWFQDTVPRAAPNIPEIAMLHLDGDWYESTMVCLDHLYERLSPGGLVMINDYGTYPGCRKAVDEFTQRLRPPPFLSQADSEIRYWVKSEGT